MLEANLLLIKKTNTTKNILKWAILCAYTKECIEPTGSSLSCTPEARTPPGMCHRQDQSIFNILIVNLEVRLRKSGNNNLLAHNSADHPKNLQQRHQTRRAQHTSNEITNCTN
uniref:Uncharacterized protein n=1 Tax=Ditylenchus dipsaci TaxID=166011 RepID=A0A915EFI3_9BILA